MLLIKTKALNTILHLSRKSKLMLTSHSMEECEALALCKTVMMEDGGDGHDLQVEAKVVNSHSPFI